MHKVKFESGTNARNHVVRCKCGYAYSNTSLAVRARGLVHLQVFEGEIHRWNDPRRTANMPMHPTPVR